MTLTPDPMAVGCVEHHQSQDDKVSDSKLRNCDQRELHSQHK